MSTVQSSELTFDSPPFFSAHWLGSHPFDQQPRVVQCFGPSRADDHASLQPTVLGLESVILGNPPPLTSVCGAMEGQTLVLHSNGREFLRSDPLPLALATVLQWRAEVLLVWVDFPMEDPRAELSVVGLEHVWTGIALVQSEDFRDPEPLPEGLASEIWGGSRALDEELPAGTAATTFGSLPRRWVQ